MADSLVDRLREWIKDYNANRYPDPIEIEEAIDRIETLEQEKTVAEIACRVEGQWHEEALARIETLEQGQAKLREALKKYGRHQPRCVFGEYGGWSRSGDSVSVPGPFCNCGFTEAST